MYPYLKFLRYYVLKNAIFRIKKQVRDQNRGEAALFMLGFGADVDFQFLTTLSLQNYGFSRKIYTDADVALQLEVRTIRGS